MMRLTDFIATKVLKPRLDTSGALVVYDPDTRYRDMCLTMASSKTVVVDATESSIETRESALRSLAAITHSDSDAKQLLVYVPRARPITDEDWQADPFASIASAGAILPEGDGDEYLSLCLRCKPDHTAEIHRVFSSDPNPPVAVIDAIGDNAGWPILEIALGVSSASDIILSLLCPSPEQKAKLVENTTWAAEAGQLLSTTLSMKWNAGSFESLRAELWRYILFSEFAFDLPVDIPDSLSAVPRAGELSRQIVYDICTRLREDRRYRDTYMEQAVIVENELNLVQHCRSIADLGERDTFPFEERSFLTVAVRAFSSKDQEVMTSLLERHSQSIWVERGENQAQWSILGAAASLTRTQKELEAYLVDAQVSGEALVTAYVQRFREADRLHREFEQTFSEVLDIPEILEPVVASAREAYRSLSSKIQEAFIRAVEAGGWPWPGLAYNADVFDKFIRVELSQSGNRVAVILVDALRYELAVELQKQLQDDFATELSPACAFLPSVTPVGMASLLPGAGSKLQIAKTDSGPVPTLDGKTMPNVSARMQVIRELYGTRFREMIVRDFLKSKKEIPAEVDLLVLRTATIDSHFEADPDTALTFILSALRQMKAVVGRLSDMGFAKSIIVTDHGFCISPVPEAGDVCLKPPGEWHVVHDRLLLGKGSGDSFNFALPATNLGIRGDYPMVAGPRALVTYRTGSAYFHGGLSLQECLVPIMVVSLTKRQADEWTVKITLSYKGGVTKVRTRRPVVKISATSDSLYAEGATFEVLLEARDKKANLIAQAVPGGPVNSATGSVTLRPGDTIGVPIRIELDFEGTLKLKALDPKTLFAYDTLELETDFSV